MIGNLAFYERIKHIEINYHFICDKVLTGVISTQDVSLSNHLTNIFTKSIMLRSKVDTPSKISIKTSNVTEYIESGIQNIEDQGKMILSSSMYEKHTYRIFLKEFLKLFKCLASSDIHMISRWLDLLFKALHQERKKRKEKIPTRIAWAP